MSKGGHRGSWQAETRRARRMGGRRLGEGRQRRITGPAGRPASLPYSSGKELRGSRFTPKLRMAQESWQGPKRPGKNSASGHRAPKSGPHSPLPVDSAARCYGNRRTHELCAVPTAPRARGAAPHWRRAVVGGANRTKARPRAWGLCTHSRNLALLGRIVF